MTLLLLQNILFIIGSSTILQTDKLFLLVECCGVHFDHFVEFKDTVRFTNWNHDTQVDFIRQHCPHRLSKSLVVNIFDDHVLVLQDGGYRLLLVHPGEADVTDAENVFIDSWSRWLALINQWMFVSHLTILIHKNLPGSLVDALLQFTL